MIIKFTNCRVLVRLKNYKIIIDDCESKKYCLFFEIQINMSYFVHKWDSVIPYIVLIWINQRR
jgi:hypothetical protein